MEGAAIPFPALFSAPLAVVLVLLGWLRPCLQVDPGVCGCFGLRLG